MSKNPLIVAIKEDDVTALKKLKENGTIHINEELVFNAACFGSPKVLDWLGSQLTNKTSLPGRGAAEYGHKECLIWLRDHGYPWDTLTCSSAVSNGHLDIFNWLREQGCLYNRVKCCHDAAYSGLIEILEELMPLLSKNQIRQSGVCQTAYGHRPEVTLWLMENGYCSCRDIKWHLNDIEFDCVKLTVVS